jgi:tetratricopeptide (TPR) repeat protein
MTLRWSVFLLWLCASLAVAQAPKPADVKKAKAVAAEAKNAFEANELDKALSKFQEAYTLNPKPGYLANIGQCFHSMGRFPEAIETYQKFLTEAPANDALRGAVEKELTKSRDALAALKESSAASAKASADTAFKSLDYKKALAGYQEANAISPRPEYLISIAQCHAALGQRDEARVAYQSFLDKAPADDPRRAAVEKELAKQEPTPTTIIATSQPKDAPKPLPKAAKTSPWPSRLILTGASLSALGAISGSLAVASAFKLQGLAELSDISQLDSAEIEKQRARMQILSPLSDALFIAAVAAGATGVILRQRAKKTEIQVSILPNAISVGLPIGAPR